MVFIKWKEKIKSSFIKNIMLYGEKNAWHKFFEETKNSSYINKIEHAKWKEKVEKGFTDTPATSEYMPVIIDNSGKLVEIKKDKYDGFVRLCQDLLK
jgi:hypothetical protein